MISRYILSASTPILKLYRQLNVLGNYMACLKCMCSSPHTNDLRSMGCLCAIYASMACDAFKAVMLRQVDCAYYSDELQEVNLDPGNELKQLLQARGLESLEASCPQCFENQQKLVSKLVPVHIPKSLLLRICWSNSAVAQSLAPCLVSVAVC